MDRLKPTMDRLTAPESSMTSSSEHSEKTKMHSNYPHGRFPSQLLCTDPNCPNDHRCISCGVQMTPAQAPTTEMRAQNTKVAGQNLRSRGNFNAISNPALLGQALPTAHELDKYLNMVKKLDEMKAVRKKENNKQVAANIEEDKRLKRETDRLHHEREVERQDRQFRFLNQYPWTIARVVVFVAVFLVVVLVPLIRFLWRL